MRRYLLSDDTKFLPPEHTEVLIIGSGMAGLYAAINLEYDMSCIVISKEGVDLSNSWLAQGGIAAAISKDDHPDFHMEDTLVAGAGECNIKAVETLVAEGPADIQTLVRLDVPFDIDLDGDLHITREGGHNKNRIVHAGGDATGRETVKTLAAIVSTLPNAKFSQHTFLVDILTQNGRACGAVVFCGGYKIIYAKYVIICTGGVGQIYKHTTNPQVATGDGIAAAVRAGAQLDDMEFVQFHPTALYEKNPSGKSFLISEALRGEGAVLRDKSGSPFMQGRHLLADLAPRDIVAREIVRQMQADGEEFVYLDITHKTKEELENRFPTIYEQCAKRGIYIHKDYIPVCPVQHFMIGGIKSDLQACSTADGLLCAGEAACTGVHGANRLASNSILECLVFGRRAAEYINQNRDIPYAKPEQLDKFTGSFVKKTVDAEEIKQRIKDICGKKVWIIREKAQLLSARQSMQEIIDYLHDARLETTAQIECFNMAIVAMRIIEGALKRQTSVGAHYREN